MKLTTLISILMEVRYYVPGLIGLSRECCVAIIAVAVLDYPHEKMVDTTSKEVSKISKTAFGTGTIWKRKAVTITRKYSRKFFKFDYREVFCF